MSQKTEELHFSVEGSFVMNLARQAYWFENRKEWALDTMACFEGMTTEQTMKILRGDASIRGTDDIEFVDSPDSEFKKELAAHNKWLADKEAKRLAEIEEAHREQEIMDDLEEKWDEGKLKTLSTENQRDALKRKARKTHDLMMSGRPEKPKEIIPPTDPFQLGKFIISKKLLDEYLKVASDHDLMEPWDAGSAIYYSGVMMKIHLQLRESVGLEGYWGRNARGEPDEFDKLLQAAIHSSNKKDERYKLRERQIRARTQVLMKEREGNLTKKSEGEPYNPDDEHPGD